MNAKTPITVDTSKLNEALKRFPRERAMLIDGREAVGDGETIERRQTAPGGDIPAGAERPTLAGKDRDSDVT